MHLLSQAEIQKLIVGVALACAAACTPLLDLEPLEFDTTSAPDSGAEETTPPPPDQDLIGWWKLDDGAGGIAKDSSLYGNDGKAENGAGWTATGKRGGAAIFDGVQSRIVIERNPKLLLEKVTFGFWLKLDADNQDDPRVFAYGYGFDVKLNGGRTPQFSESTKWAYLQSQVGLGEWHHVAFTFDAGAVAGYYDGLSVPVQSTYPAGSSIQQDFAPLIIGSNQDFNRPFKGAIDDVRLYRRVLSAAEVAELAK